MKLAFSASRRDLDRRWPRLPPIGRVHSVHQPGRRTAALILVQIRAPRSSARSLSMVRIYTRSLSTRRRTLTASSHVFIFGLPAGMRAESIWTNIATNTMPAVRRCYFVDDVAVPTSNAMANAAMARATSAGKHEARARAWHGHGTDGLTSSDRLSNGSISVEVKSWLLPTAEPNWRVSSVTVDGNVRPCRLSVRCSRIPLSEDEGRHWVGTRNGLQRSLAAVRRLLFDGCRRFPRTIPSLALAITAPHRCAPPKPTRAPSRPSGSLPRPDRGSNRQPDAAG